MANSPELPEDRLRWLVDRELIRDALARYARGVDRVDPELIRSVYHPDSSDEHGFVVVSGDEFADQEWRSSALRGPSHHLLGEPLIEITGDFAAVETYFIAHQRHGRPLQEVLAAPEREDADGDHVSLFVGRYLDRFERRDGEWRIAHRKVVMDLAEESSERPVHPLAGSFHQSARFPDDEAYHHLVP
ncbi:nuclear transport factor 2 family protein [Nocardioides humi]|uniref:Nuclear transport factor 2 family protein n=1 Tax=Nocardioides humi TaxID=449461 RepID=A0ABN2BQ54_9ACTN|nr:nuclear transport factor 2 family protein [Nocardioides humi]